MARRPYDHEAAERLELALGRALDMILGACLLAMLLALAAGMYGWALVFAGAACSTGAVRA